MPSLRIAICLVLLPTTASTRAWNVFQNGSGDAPTIQAAIDLASSGDSILVHSGVYHERLVANKQLTMVGLGGPEVTTIDGGGVAIAFRVAGPAVVLEGLRIVGSGTDESSGWPYPALHQNTYQLTARNCHIESFLLWDAIVTDCRILGTARAASGNEVRKSALFERCLFQDCRDSFGASGLTVRRDATIRQCTFRRCDGMDLAPVIGYDSGATPVVGGNLFVDCKGPCVGRAQWPPLAARDSRPSRAGGFLIVRQNTFARNENGPFGPWTRGGPHHSLFLSGSFEANVVTGSEFGVWLPPGDVSYTLSCNNSWGNDSNWTGFPDPTGVDGNISAPPLYCNAAAGDFTVAANSPLLPARNVCGALIGAFDEGCGPVALERRTWSVIKSSYRRDGP